MTERPTAKPAPENRAHLVLRILAMVLGWPLLTIGVGAWLAMLIESPWVALGVAAAVTVLPTLLLADRLLPEDDPRKGNGIASDVIALVWLGGATLVMGPLAPWLHDPLVSFTERAAGPGVPVLLADLLTGRPAETEPEPDEHVEPQADDAGIPPPDAGTLSEPESGEPSDAATPDDAGVSEDAGSDAAIDDAGQDAGSATAEMSPAEVFRTYASGVVSIEVRGTEPGRTGGGTGFIIHRSGVVATNHHVIRDAAAVRVKLLDGTYADSVELLVDDQEHDLALLQIHTTHTLQAVRLGDSDRVEVGERAIVIGNPLGLEHTLSDGIVSARRRIDEHNMIQMTAPVSPGNSGGPVFDGHGEVIGVTTAVVGIGLGQNLNLAVPVNILRTLIRDEYPDRRSFGGPRESGRGGHW